MTVENDTATCRNRFVDLRQRADLTEDTRRALSAMAHVRRYHSGQTVLFDGDDSDLVGNVISGVLRMQKTLADGRQHIVGLLVEGDMFGRVFNGALHFSVEAATDAEICAYPRAPFEKLLTRSPDLERVVMLNILNELDRARDWLIILSSQKITTRIAGFLVVMCSQFARVDHLVRNSESGPVVHVPIGRGDLAHLLGTRPESVSRAFHALARDGVIALLKPDLIRILDMEALVAEAGDEDLGGTPNLKETLQLRPPRS
ncbi:CRP/FNR family transcriptional regulator, anaerobic regulatory protein [Roseivivax marinus]|uniref:Crp/Fnr family transcriptional regulator n=1 Tax=Roseivivax marinus TaxID=1379903 RepID=UPI0008CC0A5C|nr:Crp/Fnr family transcriptional regulator [Roseivivax marinus]SEL70288.1 CRP/FNR family transcriptional regulator, anaerobic regulatory protein [Roseivivax marinus]